MALAVRPDIGGLMCGHTAVTAYGTEHPGTCFDLGANPYLAIAGSSSVMA